jgi:hypothetical protein
MVAEAVRLNQSPMPNSLLTGKITGNYSKLAILSDSRTRKPTRCGDFGIDSLRKITGKIITGSGRTLLKNRDVSEIRVEGGRHPTAFNRLQKMGVDVPVVQIGLGWRLISALPTCGLDA